MNFRFDSLNCFTLILSGEPVLNHTLERPIHEALRQRISVHYNFQGLSADETTEYIKHKIRIAGGAESIISDDALNTVANFCKGNPRIVDNVMSTALKAGAQMEKTTIDAEVNPYSSKWAGSRIIIISFQASGHEFHGLYFRIGIPILK